MKTEKEKQPGEGNLNSNWGLRTYALRKIEKTFKIETEIKKQEN